MSPSVRRDPATITTIVLHQTATEMPPSSRLVAKHGVEQAAARRAARAAYHTLALPTGDVVRAKPIDVYAHHAGLLNATSVGVAVVGRFPGLLDDPTTKRREDLWSLWNWRKRPASEITPELVDAGREAIAITVRDAKALGGDIDFIVAHRQSSKNRRSDPGEELWARLVLEYAVPKLGLRARPGFTLGTGRPVPAAWDPQCGVGSY